MPATAERKIETIEGRKVLVVERTRPIPDTLALLLEGGRDARGLWQAIRVTRRAILHLTGARPECLREDHRLVDWVEGFHVGSDGATRYLHLDACADCGSVCVRDASFDTLDRLPSSRSGPRRKSHVIGWYSGARPGSREYR